MKKLLAVSFYTFVVSFTLAQTPKSAEYEKDDFFMIVLLNPEFSLCDFKHVHLNDRNTKLENEDFYQKRRISNDYLHEHLLKVFGKCDHSTVHIAYMKISASWRAYKDIQYRNECFHAEDKRKNDRFKKDNIFHTPIDKVVEHKLRIVPLKLERY